MIEPTDHVIFRFCQRFDKDRFHKVSKHIESQGAELNEVNFAHYFRQHPKHMNAIKNAIEYSNLAGLTDEGKLNYKLNDPEHDRNEYYSNKKLKCVFLVRDNVAITCFKFSYLHFRKLPKIKTGSGEEFRKIKKYDF